MENTSECLSYMVQINVIREAFSNLIEKCQNKTSNWCNKSLSIAGKETLIKSVLQATPTYMMSCVQFPKSVIDKLQSLLFNFWWGEEEGKRKTHWIRRETFYNHKSLGGLGFKNLYSFNLALLAKQAWHLLQFPNSLLATVLKAKYFHNSELLTAPERGNSSYVWKSIFAALGFLRKGVIFDITSNKYSWSSSTDECFSTKSVYSFIEVLKVQNQNQGASSSVTNTQHFWKYLWRMS